MRNCFSKVMMLRLTSPSIDLMPCSSLGKLSMNTVSSYSSPIRFASSTSVRWRRVTDFSLGFFSFFSSNCSWMFSGSKSSKGASSLDSLSSAAPSTYSESLMSRLRRRAGRYSWSWSSMSLSSLACSMTDSALFESISLPLELPPPPTFCSRYRAICSSWKVFAAVVEVVEVGSLARKAP